MCMLESVFLHARLKYQVVLMSFVMMSSAETSISMSTLIFTSSWAVSSEEQPEFTQAQQAWIQSLLADMSQCDLSNLNNQCSFLNGNDFDYL